MDDLAAVLDRLLEDGGAAAGPAARLGAACVLPAIRSLGAVAAQQAVTSWDGVVHRRCRIEPVGAAATEEGDARAGQAVTSPGSAARGEEGALSVSRTVKGRWELVRARLVLEEAGEAWPGGAVITHDFARRLPGGGDEERPGPAPRPDAPGQPGGVAHRPQGRESATECLSVVVAHERVLEWAEASGDRNVVHTSAGAARRAGLRAGSDEVVVHGLLLGAVSSGLVPPEPGRPLSLTFVAPATVPVDGATRLDLDRRSGDLGVDALLLMTRR